MPTGSFYSVFVIFPTCIASVKSAKSVLIPSHSTHTLHSCFCQRYGLSPCGQSVVRHLMEVVSAWRRELVHVRTAETNNINDSKHESMPTGSFYPVFVITPHTHSISQISQIRIQLIPSAPV